ncbi:hypothetical protein MRX96_005515 [Rhipicephalus microplus]
MNPPPSPCAAHRRNAAKNTTDSTNVAGTTAQPSAATGRRRREGAMIALWKHGDLLPPAACYTLASCWERSSLVPPKEHLCTVGFARPVDVGWNTLEAHRRSESTRRSLLPLHPIGSSRGGV